MPDKTGIDTESAEKSTQICFITLQNIFLWFFSIP